MSYLPINLHRLAATSAHLVLRASVSHFLPPAATATVTSAARVLKQCSLVSPAAAESCPHQDVGRWWGDGVQDQGKIDSSPLVGGLCGVSPHARPHTHTGGHPRVARPTHKHQRAICQPSFFYFFFPPLRSGTCWAHSMAGFNGFLHTLEFFRASSPFSRISMHTYTPLREPRTLSK